MNENATQGSMQPPAEQAKPNWPLIVIRFALYMFLSPILLFLSAGTLDWPMAWLYVGLLLASIIGSRLISLLRHPDLLRERAETAECAGAPSWDRVLVPLVAFLAPILILVVAGLDHRFGWSPDFAPVVQYVAAFMVFLGYGVSVWAMAVNRFFSAVARIQEDRGQTVVTSGPYRIVRHPSYGGGILAGLAFPFMLNTLWALVPSIVGFVPLIIRTIFEDGMLMSDLNGYAEYAKRVRYRLIPGIW